MEKRCFFINSLAPFGKPQKRGAEVGAAAILGMTGLVGGIMSSESQSAANARNLSLDIIPPTKPVIPRIAAAPTSAPRF